VAPGAPGWWEKSFTAKDTKDAKQNIQ
jgi:hypothetical protein